MIDSAIVGLGRWGRGHVKSMQMAGNARPLRFVRAIDPVLDAHRAFAEEHGMQLSASLDDALADPKIRAIVLGSTGAGAAEGVGADVEGPGEDSDPPARGESDPY